MQETYINTSYQSLVQDPINAMKKIYDHFNIPFTKDAENAMELYLKDNPQHKHGKHEYSLEKFGISKDDVKTNFKQYLEYFNLEI